MTTKNPRPPDPSNPWTLLPSQIGEEPYFVILWWNEVPANLNYDRFYNINR
jgi:hypothetical protein